MAGGAAAVVVADGASKWWVQRSLALGETVPLLGDAVRLTYVLNPGAAFGIHVGELSSSVFSLLAVLALVVIAAIVRATPAAERGRLAALALVAGGATGNLLDRLVGEGGVVDFMDVGVAGVRLPIFNVADVGVALGAFLLVALLWEDEPEEEGGPR